MQKNFIFPGLSSLVSVCHNACPCAGTFLRGALEKVGVDPNIKRIGVYKSAGDGSFGISRA